MVCISETWMALASRRRARASIRSPPDASRSSVWSQPGSRGGDAEIHPHTCFGSYSTPFFFRNARNSSSKLRLR